MMKLYYSPGTCALSPQIALREAGLNFDMVRVDLKEHKLFDTKSDYYAINPKGAVPALELDNGKILTEGPAIVQYIADQVPQKNLAPANGTLDRTKLQEFLNYITSELHKGIGGLFNPAMPEEFREVTRAMVQKKYAYIDNVLSKSPYLMGNDYSIADSYLYNVTRWAAYDAVKIDLSMYQNLTAFMTRMNARPSVQAALQAEGMAA
jgi:glutathione S-transferase